jgi:hypothetical protein
VEIDVPVQLFPDFDKERNEALFLGVSRSVLRLSALAESVRKGFATVNWWPHRECTGNDLCGELLAGMGPACYQ